MVATYNFGSVYMKFGSDQVIHDKGRVSTSANQ